MDAVFGWVKNLVFFYILMTAVLHVLPKNSYQKYVRFFGGLLLVVLLLTPVLEFLYQPGYLLDKISYESFWQEMNTVQLDMEGMETAQKQVYIQEYENAIAGDIAQMVQEEELVVYKVSVLISEDYQLKNISLSVGLKEEGGIYVEKMVLQDNSREYPEVLKLKEKIMDFYEVDDSQIQIAVKEG